MLVWVGEMWLIWLCLQCLLEGVLVVSRHVECKVRMLVMGAGSDGNYPHSFLVDGGVHLY